MKDTPHFVETTPKRDDYISETKMGYVGHRWTAWEKPPGEQPFRRCLECPAVEVKPRRRLP